MLKQAFADYNKNNDIKEFEFSDVLSLVTGVRLAYKENQKDFINSLAEVINHVTGLSNIVDRHNVREIITAVHPLIMAQLDEHHHKAFEELKMIVDAPIPREVRRSEVAVWKHMNKKLLQSPAILGVALDEQMQAEWKARFAAFSPEEAKNKLIVMSDHIAPGKNLN